MRSPFFYSGIYAILEPQRRDPVAYTHALLAGGVRVVQVRAKTGLDRELLRALVPIVRGYNGIVIVNDDVYRPAATVFLTKFRRLFIVSGFR